MRTIIMIVLLNIFLKDGILKIEVRQFESLD